MLCNEACCSCDSSHQNAYKNPLAEVIDQANDSHERFKSSIIKHTSLRTNLVVQVSHVLWQHKPSHEESQRHIQHPAVSMGCRTLCNNPVSPTHVRRSTCPHPVCKLKITLRLLLTLAIQSLFVRGWENKDIDTPIDKVSSSLRSTLKVSKASHFSIRTNSHGNSLNGWSDSQGRFLSVNVP